MFTPFIICLHRFFIDEVCTDVLHISGAARRLTQSHGNYSTWMARRQEQQLAYSRQVAGREAEIEKLKEYAGHGFRYGGSASQINKMQMKAKQAEKLEEAAKEQEDVGYITLSISYYIHHFNQHCEILQIADTLTV